MAWLYDSTGRAKERFNTVKTEMIKNLARTLELPLLVRSVGSAEG